MRRVTTIALIAGVILAHNDRNAQRPGQRGRIPAIDARPLLAGAREQGHQPEIRVVHPRNVQRARGVENLKPVAVIAGEVHRRRQDHLHRVGRVVPEAGNAQMARNAGKLGDHDRRRAVRIAF